MHRIVELRDFQAAFKKRESSGLDGRGFNKLLHCITEHGGMKQIKDS